MSIDSGEVSRRIDELADRLTASGDLNDQKWRAALHAAPRHLFIPPIAWTFENDQQGRLIDREARPQSWMDAAYGVHPIITQFDDGADHPSQGGHVYTSSCSSPDIAIAFLEMLGPYDHDRVLEIGTGTGWTAALLSHRVGERNVTSVEIDPSVTKQAAINLESAGYAPSLIVGDGATVIADGGPFDRVHVTCGVTTVPYSWIVQTRPGGVIAFPWMPDFGDGHRIALTVRSDGSAIGRLAGGCEYMMIRSQRDTFTPFEGEGDDKTTTRLDPRRVARDAYGADAAIAGMLPTVMGALSDGENGRAQLRLQAGNSWAACEYRPGDDEYPVWQTGDRRLWDEIEAAYFQWISWGRPSRDRFGMTVTRDGQHIWLDDPCRIIGKE